MEIKAVIEAERNHITDDAQGIERDGKPINKVGEAETSLHGELKNGPRAAREMIELARQLCMHPKAREKRGSVISKAGENAGWMCTNHLRSLSEWSALRFILSVPEEKRSPGIKRHKAPCNP